MSARYVDHSAEFLRFFVNQLAPAAQAIGDVVHHEITSRIQLQEEPSKPGEGIASPPPEHILLKQWRRSKVRIFENQVSLIVYNRSRTEDGYSLVKIHEEGTDRMEPRPTVHPGLEAARRAAQGAAVQALR